MASFLFEGEGSITNPNIPPHGVRISSPPYAHLSTERISAAAPLAALVGPVDVATGEEGVEMSTLDYLRLQYDQGPKPSRWEKPRNRYRGRNSRLQAPYNGSGSGPGIRRHRSRASKWTKVRTYYGAASAKLANVRKALFETRRLGSNEFGRGEHARLDSNRLTAPPIAIAPITNTSPRLRDIGTTQLPLFWNFFLSCVTAAGLLFFVYAASHVAGMKNDGYNLKSRLPYYFVISGSFVVFASGFASGFASVVYLLRAFNTYPQVIDGLNPELGFELDNLQPRPQQAPDSRSEAISNTPDDPLPDVLGSSAYDEDPVVREVVGLPGQAL